MVRHSDCLIIVWRLAEFEASRFAVEKLEPAHFFLGLLKVVDIPLARVLKSNPELDRGRRNRALSEAKELDDCFQKASISPSQLRRAIRKELAVSGAQKPDKEARIRRSERCRSLFEFAENSAEEFVEGDATETEVTVTPCHLLFSYLQEQQEESKNFLNLLKYAPDSLIDFALNALLHRKSDDQEQSQGSKSNEREARKDFRKPNNQQILKRLGRNLTGEAKEGKLSPIIGRDAEIKKLAQSLLRNRKNNVIITGEAGVGKTGLVEGLAQKIADGSVPKEFQPKKIIEISMPSIVAGTCYRGDLEERLQSLIKEAESDENTILFIDEIHLIMGGGGKESKMDAANILKPALSRGSIRVIGATTTQEYRAFIEKDPAMERRFEVIELEEPSRDQAVEILNGVKEQLQGHHHVKIDAEAICAAVDLSIRYLPDLRLPDKAIDIVDQACSQARLQTLSKDLKAQVEKGMGITEHDIRSVVASRCKIPLSDLTEDESEKLLNLDDELRKRIRGQDNALAVVADAIRLSKVGLKKSNKPIGAFLFAGATGTGKTETAKALAETLFGSEEMLIRFDMSEYTGDGAFYKMIGSPPGYRDHEAGGTLTNQIRSRPHCVILFDEIEKANPQVFDLFLQIFDEGRLKDSSGRQCDFRETVIIFTSNLGSRVEKNRGMGFGMVDGEEVDLDEYEKKVHMAIKSSLRPELVNRFTDIVVYKPLNRDVALDIIDKFITKTQAVVADKGLSLQLTEEVRNYLLENGFSEEYGARELERVIDREILKPLSRLVLGGKVKNVSVKVSADEDKTLELVGGL